MKAFTKHRGVAAPILTDNVDTDQIIPSREMNRVSKHGLGEGLFAGLRYRYEGVVKVDKRSDFVLNQPAYANASILLCGKNFGCGSSREHAVWALADFGIRAVVAESFGRIFSNNCMRNGVLAISLTNHAISALHAETLPDPQTHQVQIDLERGTISVAETSFDFEIDAADRKMLLMGLDPIDQTLQYENEIKAFQKQDNARRPWAYLAADTGDID